MDDWHLSLEDYTEAGIQINGVVFTSYAFFMKLQRPVIESNQEPHLAQICLAGAGSGVVAASVNYDLLFYGCQAEGRDRLLTCPTELIKVNSIIGI